MGGSQGLAGCRPAGKLKQAPRGTCFSLSKRAKLARFAQTAYFTAITGAFDACPEMVSTTFWLPAGTPEGTTKLA